MIIHDDDPVARRLYAKPVEAARAAQCVSSVRPAQVIAHRPRLGVEERPPADRACSRAEDPVAGNLGRCQPGRNHLAHRVAFHGRARLHRNLDQRSGRAVGCDRAAKARARRRLLVTVKHRDRSARHAPRPVGPRLHHRRSHQMNRPRIDWRAFAGLGAVQRVMNHRARRGTRDRHIHRENAIGRGRDHRRGHHRHGGQIHRHRRRARDRRRIAVKAALTAQRVCRRWAAHFVSQHARRAICERPPLERPTG